MSGSWPTLLARPSASLTAQAIAPPHDGWDWYAAYLNARQRGSAPDDAEAAADRYMADVKHVAVTRP